MKPKFYLASFIACFLVLNGFAQKKQNIYFMKDDGRYVNNRDSADFIRVVQEPDSGTVLYNVMEYYPSGNTKFLGKSSTIDPIKLEGTTASFYPDKKRKRVAAYEKGNILGLVYDYNPNGKQYRTLEYKPDSKKLNPESEEIVRDVYDSTGVQTVKDGNGHYVVFSNNYKTIKEEGNVKNGKREGIWKGTSNKGKTTFTEEYADGKFIKGTNTDENGHTINYTVKEALPSFKGGESGFGQYLGQSIRYPEASRNRGVQGRVILSFVVERDGSLTGIKILKSVSYDIDAEAIRVISQSPKWNPGVQHGIPVKVAYTMPINFALGR